eukprot:SAG31_NODE_46774_length_253_cov_0.662338_1_plen_43_part_01
MVRGFGLSREIKMPQCRFKIHAPKMTTITGALRSGKLTYAVEP